MHLLIVRSAVSRLSSHPEESHRVVSDVEAKVPAQIVESIGDELTREKVLRNGKQQEEQERRGTGVRLFSAEGARSAAPRAKCGAGSTDALRAGPAASQPRTSAAGATVTKT